MKAPLDVDPTWFYCVSFMEVHERMLPLDDLLLNEEHTW